MPNNRCLRYINTFVFVCIRLVIAVYYIWWLVPGMFHMFCFTMTLQKENWWHSKTEPIFTNCSPYNAFFCWLLWISMEFTFYVLGMYGIIGCIALVVLVVKLITQ